MAVRKEVPKDERVWAAPAYKSIDGPAENMEKVSDQLKPPPAHSQLPALSDTRLSREWTSVEVVLSVGILVLAYAACASRRS